MQSARVYSTQHFPRCVLHVDIIKERTDRTRITSDQCIFFFFWYAHNMLYIYISSPRKQYKPDIIEFTLSLDCVAKNISQYMLFFFFLISVFVVFRNKGAIVSVVFN